MRSNERGVALIHAIMFVFLLSTAVAVVTGVFLARFQALRHEADRLQALYAAEAGVAAAIAEPSALTRSGSTLRGSIGRGTYEVKVAGGDSSTEVAILATGSCSGVRRTVTVHGTLSNRRFVARLWEEGAPSGRNDANGSRARGRP